MICIGDSLTRGMLGHSYIEYCERPGSGAAKILNRGVNGDTTRCAFERLEEYLAKPSYDDQDIYVIAIGTNDILLPYLSRVSYAWRAETSLRCRIKKCINDDDVFRQEYEKYFTAISSYNMEHPQNRKKMITIGLPYIELKDYPLYEVYRHNETIRELSAKYGVSFIDMCSIQRDAAGAAKADAAVYTWKHKNLIRLVVNLAMLICPPIKDMLSRSRGLRLTVDGVHYNSLSAELLGRALDDTQGREPSKRLLM